MQTYGTYDPASRIEVPAVHGGAWCLCFVTALSALQDSFHDTNHKDLQSCLAQAEVDGEISEFCALSIQAILEMAQRSEFATDYLDMAEAAASSAHERAIIAEARMAHDWLQTNSASAIEPIRASLVRDSTTARLWNKLLIALRRVGEMRSRGGGGDVGDPRAA